MSYTTLLIHTCTIERYSSGSDNAYGQPVKTWADHLVDEACRLATAVARMGMGVEIRRGAEVVIADHKLFLGDVDVTEQDRVTVTTDDGAVDYEIILVVTRINGIGDHHMECFLRTVR